MAFACQANEHHCWENAGSIFTHFISKAHYVPIAIKGLQEKPPVVSIRIDSKTEHFNNFSRLFPGAGDGARRVCAQPGRRKNSGGRWQSPSDRSANHPGVIEFVDRVQRV